MTHKTWTEIPTVTLVKLARKVRHLSVEADAKGDDRRFAELAKIGLAAEGELRNRGRYA